MQTAAGRVCACVGFFDTFMAWWFNHFLICPLGQYHPCNYPRVRGLLALQRCTSGSFVFVYDESLSVQVREETKPRMREGNSGAGCWLAELPPSHSLIGQLFSLTSGSLGSQRHTKTSIPWTIKQEKGGRSTCFGSHCLLLPHEKLLCSLLQYDTPFTSSLMNQWLSKNLN